MDLSETGIVNDTLIGPFGVPERVKINSKANIDFLEKFIIPWYKKQHLAFKRKAKLLQDGDPAHTVHLSRPSLTKWASKAPF